MSKPIFFGRIDFLELLTAVSFLSSDKERSDWLMSFSRALAKNEIGKNDLADAILNEAMGAREAETKRKEAYRSKFVPRTDTEKHGTDKERHGKTRKDKERHVRPAERQTVSVSVSESITHDTDICKNDIRYGVVGKQAFPTQEECKEHFAAHGSTEKNALEFFNYYSANGWMVGKNKMKSWRSAASLWISRSHNNHAYGAPRETTQERINRENMERYQKMLEEDGIPFLEIK